jgi:serine/threonine protein kinase
MFMAPELSTGEDYRYPVDVYAYEMMLYIIRAESFASSEGRQSRRFRQRVLGGGRPDIPAYLPDSYRNADPKRRPTFAEIFANPDALMLPTCNEDRFVDYRFDVLKLP